VIVINILQSATAEQRALAQFGPCAIYRATFAPVREVGVEHAG
jgi:hypothetical protein